MKALLILLLFSLLAFAQVAREKTVPELGVVKWGTDHAQALATAEASGKPVFLMFQEIPGCATCTRFGAEVLSHPVLSSAIEHQFVPLVVNNRPGGGLMEEEDRRALMKKYQEPAWNNPVVRFVNGEGKDLIPRADRQYTAAQVSLRMMQALTAAEQEIPHWLRLAHLEADRSNLKTAVVAMYCFWTGEARLGALDGVVNVEAGFKDGREVVTITYHEPTVSYVQVIEHASRMDCARQVYARSDAEQAQAAAIVGDLAVPFGEKEPRTAPGSDRRRHSMKSLYPYLPLTPAQRTKVNSSLATQKDATVWLTDTQKAILEKLPQLKKEDPMAFLKLRCPDDPSQLMAHQEKLLRTLGL